MLNQNLPNRILNSESNQILFHNDTIPNLPRSECKPKPAQRMYELPSRNEYCLHVCGNWPLEMILDNSEDLACVSAAVGFVETACGWIVDHADCAVAVVGGENDGFPAGEFVELGTGLVSASVSSSTAGEHVYVRLTFSCSISGIEAETAVHQRADNERGASGVDMFSGSDDIELLVCGTGAVLHVDGN